VPGKNGVPQSDASSEPSPRPAPIRPHRGGARWKRVVLRLLPGVLVLVLLGAGLFTWGWLATPGVNDLAARVQAVDHAHQAPSTLLGQISPLIQQALIVTEDEHFYQHHGIDLPGTLRAAWDDLLAGRVIEGGSTLTEQLAKEVYLGGNDHTLDRKLEDMVLALKIEAHYRKGQILEFYLNVVSFGDGAYGIGAATAHYFQRPPAQVDLAQAALLAGLVQAPSAYDPWCHPNAARMRQQTVLDRLRTEGAITAAQATTARAEMLPFWAPDIPRTSDPFCSP
jgi:membrane peptidoglycan carboxypeptidase